VSNNSNEQDNIEQGAAEEKGDKKDGDKKGDDKKNTDKKDKDEKQGDKTGNGKKLGDKKHQGIGEEEGEEDEEKRGERVENHLADSSTQEEEPTSSGSKLWLLGVVFGVGVLLLAMYAVKRRSRINATRRDAGYFPAGGEPPAPVSSVAISTGGWGESEEEVPVEIGVPVDTFLVDTFHVSLPDSSVAPSAATRSTPSSNNWPSSVPTTSGAPSSNCWSVADSV